MVTKMNSILYNQNVFVQSKFDLLRCGVGWVQGVNRKKTKSKLSSGVQDHPAVKRRELSRCESTAATHGTLNAVNGSTVVEAHLVSKDERMRAAMA